MSREQRFVWDGNALALELDSSRGRRSFVHWPGELEPLLHEERGEVFAYVTDQVGVPRELIDGAGRVAWAASLTAFGRVVEEQRDEARASPVESPFRLLGQVYDEESGLSWTRFRCFDAETGRWLSADPLGIQGGVDVFSFNGAPTFLVDPLGLTGNPHGGASPTAGAATSGASTADEPEVKAFIEKFKQRYPGRPFQSGHERRHSDGRMLEIDFETDNAIIEFKRGRGTGLTRQIKDRTDAGVNPDGKTCVGMACSPKGMSQFVKKDVESIGGLGASESETDTVLDILAP